MTTDPDGKPYAHNAEQAEAHKLARAELAVAQNWVQHHSKHAEDLIDENVELRAELAAERARMKKIETALKDAISTYFGADKLVTAERIEAWQFAMKEDGK